MKEGLEILSEIARVNGTVVPKGELVPAEKNQLDSTLIDLFKPFQLAVNTLIQAFAW